jgi:hypothetical protein
MSHSSYIRSSVTLAVTVNAANPDSHYNYEEEHNYVVWHLEASVQWVRSTIYLDQDHRHITYRHTFIWHK